MSKNPKHEVPTQIIGGDSNKKLIEFEKLQKLEQNRKNLNNKLAILRKVMCEFYYDKDFGPNHPMTKTMFALHKNIMYLQQSVKMVYGMRTASEVLFSTIEQLDDEMTFISNLFEGSLTTRYTWFNRLKRKRQIRKANKNIVGRMKSFMDQMIGITDITQEMVKQFDTMSRKMFKQTDIINHGGKEPKNKQPMPDYDETYRTELDIVKEYGEKTGQEVEDVKTDDKDPKGGSGAGGSNGGIGSILF